MWKKFSQMPTLNKRIKFLVTTAVLTLGFLIMSLYITQSRLGYIGLLTIATLLLFVWSLWEGLRLNATLLVLILPAFFTFGVGLFWFLLPARVLTTLPVIGLFAMGTYALVLTSNIYVVSAIRTIALVRAAKGVGFVMTLFTLFLLYDAILSLRLPLHFNALTIALVSLPLLVQGLWAGKLTEGISQKVLLYSLVFSINIAAVSALIYFWPVSVVVGSLFITGVVYVLLGLGQAKLDGRLFKQTIREYAIVGAAVFLATFFTTHWRG
mgnify:CR=1 FL=1